MTVPGPTVTRAPGEVYVGTEPPGAALAAAPLFKVMTLPDTAASLNNLAGLLESRGRLDEAEPLYRRALAILESVLGPEHPNTVTVRGNLEALLRPIDRPPLSGWARLKRWLRG